jgi:hypothetical protein
MGQSKNHPPCVQFAAVFSSDPGLLAACWERLESLWGPIADQSDAWDFVESEYYHATMGRGLKKQLAVFRDPYDPAQLWEHKLLGNRLEWELPEATGFHGPGNGENETSLGVAPSLDVTRVPQQALVQVQRPINIDPGYLSLTKLVLASTKNREHRIYLREGIYAEVTLAYRDQAWQTMPWTYADYQRADVRAFLAAARRRFAASIAARAPLPSGTRTEEEPHV